MRLNQLVLKKPRVVEFWAFQYDEYKKNQRNEGVGGRVDQKKKKGRRV